MKALSLRQPWIDAVLNGGKRIENRLAWNNCSHRGPLLLHAAKVMTRDDWEQAHQWAVHKGLTWRPPPGTPFAPAGSPKHWNTPWLVFGAIVGRCDVVDVIFPGGVRRSPAGAILGPHPRRDDPWYMGGFALVLDNVHSFGLPTYCAGMLGLFTPSDDVLAVLPP